MPSSGGIDGAFPEADRFPSIPRVGSRAARDATFRIEWKGDQLRRRLEQDRRREAEARNACHVQERMRRRADELARKKDRLRELGWEEVLAGRDKPASESVSAKLSQDLDELDADRRDPVDFHAEQYHGPGGRLLASEDWGELDFEHLAAELDEDLDEEELDAWLRAARSTHPGKWGQVNRSRDERREASRRALRERIAREGIGRSRGRPTAREPTAHPREEREKAGGL